MSKIKNVAKNLVKCMNCMSNVAVEVIEIAEIVVDKDDGETKNNIKNAEKITKAIHKGLEALENRLDDETSEESTENSGESTENSDEYQSAESKLEIIKPTKRVNFQRQNEVVEVYKRKTSNAIYIKRPKSL